MSLIYIHTRTCTEDINFTLLRIITICLKRIRSLVNVRRVKLFTLISAYYINYLVHFCVIDSIVN